MLKLDPSTRLSYLGAYTKAELIFPYSALTAIIGGLPSSSGGRVEFTAHEYPAGEFLVDGEKSTHNCSIAYMRLYFANDRSILIGAMFGTSDPDWWSKYVATSKILVLKNIGSEYFGWTSI